MIPGIYFDLPLQHWDYMCVLACSAFSWRLYSSSHICMTSILSTYLSQNYSVLYFHLDVNRTNNNASFHSFHTFNLWLALFCDTLVITLDHNYDFNLLEIQFSCITAVGGKDRHEGYAISTAEANSFKDSIEE